MSGSFSQRATGLLFCGRKQQIAKNDLKTKQINGCAHQAIGLHHGFLRTSAEKNKDLAGKKKERDGVGR